MTNRKFTNFSFFLIFYCIFIVVWGAWVRISGSGDGCGKHWPLCNGEMFPSDSLYFRLQTFIEYLHRVKSGFFGLLVLFQFFLVPKLYPKGSVVRAFSLYALLFTVTEALLGALLVLGGYVTTDDSVGRLLVMSLHLGNTLFLLGSLTLVWSSARDGVECRSTSPLRVVKKILPLFSVFFLIATTGAWAALSTTLFPSDNLLGGLTNDFSNQSHYLLRLRILHPLVAASGAIFLWLKLSESPKLLQGLLLFQVFFGIVTLSLHSPVWMKLTHLAISELLWVWVVTYTYRQALDLSRVMEIKNP